MAREVQLAYSTPLPSKSTEVPGLDALPTTVTFQASGTERDLKDLIAGAELEGVYHGGGYLIQRDAIKASFGSKMTDDLLQDLQGDAIWKSLAAYEAGQKGGSTTIPLFHNSAGQKSWTSAELLETSLVTRAQLLTVARKQVSTLQFEETLSPGSPGRLEHVREAVLNTLLRVAEEQCREYAVESWKLVVSSNLLADLSPDRIARLNASLEAHHNLNSQKEGSAEYANIQAKFQDDLALLDETDFVYDVAGERTMPKAIKLFQLNSALLSQIRSIALESTRVVGKGGGEMRFLGSFGELISPQMTKTIDKPFSVTRSEFLNRGDRDVHTKDDHATSIVVWHDEPLVSGNEVHLNVYCRVKERAGDETTLGMDDVVVMNKPADFLNFALGDTIMYGRPDSVRRNRFDPAFSDDWREELHTFRRLSLPANSLLRNVEVKPDSRGGDDTEEGRMGFRGVVRIPYYVRTEPEWRFTVRRTRQ